MMYNIRFTISCYVFTMEVLILLAYTTVKILELNMHDKMNHK